MNYSENTTVSSSTIESTKQIKVRKHLFTGNEKHDISLENASRFTKRYRDSVAKDAIKGGYVGRVALEKILVQQGCVGIRCYFAEFDNGNPTLVLTGARENKNDIWDGVISEDIMPCPPYCSTSNALNSSEQEQDMSVKRKVMIFTGHENHLVTLAEASRLTRNFREKHPERAIKGGYLSRRSFEQNLAQDSCVGIRFYFAVDDDGSPTLVLVGVRPNGNDIIDGVISEDIMPCPPYCSATNPLNS